eukprot:5876696-Pyramimonas_sp.AAC.1
MPSLFSDSDSESTTSTTACSRGAKGPLGAAIFTAFPLPCGWSLGVWSLGITLGADANPSSNLESTSPAGPPSDPG